MNLTTTALTQRWQCSTKTVRRLLDAGLLTHMRITSNHILIPEAAVEEYEAKRTVQQRRGLEGKRRTA